MEIKLTTFKRSFDFDWQCCLCGRRLHQKGECGNGSYDQALTFSRYLPTLAGKRKYVFYCRDGNHNSFFTGGYDQMIKRLSIQIARITGEKFNGD